MTILIIIIVGIALNAAIWHKAINKAVEMSGKREIAWSVGKSGVIGPLVEPAPDAFPIRYRSPYITQNRGTTGIPSSPFFSESPQSIASDSVVDLDLFTRDDSNKPTNWEKEHPDLYYRSLQYQQKMNAETASDHEGLMAIECDVEY